MLVICGGPWVIRKTMIWTIKVIERGQLTMFFKMAICRAIYIGNIGKTAKIRHFVDLNPLNGLFYANFIAQPLGADAKDILVHFWGVKNFVLSLGGPEKGSKWAIFGHFQVRRVSFYPLDTLNSDFGAKIGLLSRLENNRNNIRNFHIIFTIKFLNIAQILTWE